jgi:G3E family GTPase
VGCSLAASLVASIKEFKRQTSPDFLFVEPSEMVPTLEMRHLTYLGRRDMAYHIGPFITLVEGPTFQMFWQERQPLLLALMAGADLVAVSKADRVDAGQMTAIVNTLQAYGHGVLQLSARTGLGLKEVINAIGGPA